MTEHIILFRIGPIIDKRLPTEQAGFQPGRDTTEQVLPLIFFVKTGFEKRPKTGTAFFDLSAAYSTVWHNGLTKIIKYKKTVKQLKRMTGPRNFTVLLGGDLSKMKIIKNGVPQGSVLALAFFNVYTADIPDTISRKFTYADDLVVACQARVTKKIEKILEADCQTLFNYFNKWYLKLNTTKAVTNLFYVNNHEVNKTLNIKINNSKLPYDKNPNTLGHTWIEL